MFMRLVLLSSCALAAAAVTAQARDAWLEGSTTVGVAHDDSSASVDDGASEIRNQFGASGDLTYVKNLRSGDQVRLGGGIGAEAYQHAHDLDRFGYWLNGEYRTDLNDDFQLRLQATLDGKRSDEMEVFRRMRGGVQLRYRQGREHLTWGRLRLGYRDQNEDTFTGYDQSELLVELGHDWRPHGDRRALIGTVYGDFRSAEESRYSYDEIGGRLIARQPVHENLEMSVRLHAFSRRYDDVFSTSYPIDRRDHRLSVTLQGDYQLTEHVTLSVYGGWKTNSSNVPTRDYDGPVTGISLTFNHLFWEK